MWCSSFFINDPFINGPINSTFPVKHNNLHEINVCNFTITKKCLDEAFGKLLHSMSASLSDFNVNNPNNITGDQTTDLSLDLSLT